MKTNQKVQQLLDRIREALEVDRTDQARAVELLRGVAAEAERLGLESAYLRWVTGVTQDERGELEMAWEELEKAVAADPLSLPVRHSFEVIARRVREALAAPGRAADDPSTPRLYALLSASNEADLGAHLAMVRWQVATGRAAEARDLARAATTLHPASREAWQALAAAARALGDDLTAAAAELEAAEVAAAEPLFGVLGQARA